MTLLPSSNCVKGNLLFVRTQAVYRIYTTLVCWEGLPLLNVNKYINALWTTEHQCRGKWGFCLSKAALKYIEDFIRPFWWEGVLFATVLSCCLRHAAFVRNTKDVNLNPAHYFLAETLTSLMPAHTSRWQPRPSFPLWIFVWCMCVTQPPNKAVFFPLLMNSATFILSVGITTWLQTPCISPTLAEQLKS